jgi:RimJ/RimL family protein N-acetyltransferase
VLETERLLLRRPEARDAEAFEEAVGDADVMRHIGDGLPHGPDHAARWMEIDRQRWDSIRARTQVARALDRQRDQRCDAERDEKCIDRLVAEDPSAEVAEQDGVRGP